LRHFETFSERDKNYQKDAKNEKYQTVKFSEANNGNGEGGVVFEDHSEASSSESENSDFEDIPELEAKNANQEVCGQDSGCTAVLTLLNVSFFFFISNAKSPALSSLVGGVKNFHNNHG
jgi:hypothetical protein